MFCIFSCMMLITITVYAPREAAVKNWRISGDTRMGSQRATCGEGIKNVFDLYFLLFQIPVTVFVAFLPS